MALYLAIGGWIALQWLGADSNALRPAEIAFEADPQALARALELGRETLAERIARRLNPLAALPALVVVLPTTLAAMLAGIALWKNRLLAAEWPRARLRRLGAMCVLIAVPPLVALAVWAISVGLPGVVVGANALVFSAPFDLALAIGWAALAMALFAKAAPSVLAATGRIALTNYLATSVVLGFACAS